MRQVRLPDCEKLPPIGSKASESCFRIGIPHMAQVVQGEGCLSFSFLIFFLSTFSLVAFQLPRHVSVPCLQSSPRLGKP